MLTYYLASTAIWKTRDGKALAVGQMSDNHLGNTILLLEGREDTLNKSISAAWSVSATFTGDYALQEVDRDIERMERLLANTRQWLSILRIVQERRMASKGGQ